MLGRVAVPEIAEAVGVSVPSLKTWLRDKRLTAARAVSDTICAEYNRLRQRAFRCGLRLSSQNGCISLWVSVKENLSYAEADLYLRFTNQRQRLIDMEAEFSKFAGSIKPTGNAVGVSDWVGELHRPAETPPL